MSGRGAKRSRGNGTGLKPLPKQPRAAAKATSLSKAGNSRISHNAVKNGSASRDAQGGTAKSSRRSRSRSPSRRAKSRSRSRRARSRSRSRRSRSRSRSRFSEEDSDGSGSDDDEVSEGEREHQDIIRAEEGYPHRDHEPDASNPTSQKSMVSNFAAEDIENDTHARLRKTAQQTKKLPRMKFKLIRDEDEDLVDIHIKAADGKFFNVSQVTSQFDTAESYAITLIHRMYYNNVNLDFLFGGRQKTVTKRPRSSDTADTLVQMAVSIRYPDEFSSHCDKKAFKQMWYTVNNRGNKYSNDEMRKERAIAGQEEDVTLSADQIMEVLLANPETMDEIKQRLGVNGSN